MRVLFIVAILATALPQFADKEYAGKDLGWVRLLDPDEPQKPYTVDHRTYSVKQMATSQLIASWVQRSYAPQGAVGQAQRLVNDKLGLYNQYSKSLPLTYGTVTRTFIDLKKDPHGKWTPASATGWSWMVAVNGRIGDHVDLLTTPDQYYFYIPGSAGLSPEDTVVSQLDGFPDHPAVRKFGGFYQPKGIRTTLQYVVVLAKDNQPPYVPVTRGEFLEKLGLAIEREYRGQLDEIARDTTLAPVIRTKWSGERKAEYDQRQAVLANLKGKYANRLSEPAEMFQEQPTVRIESGGGSDPMEIPAGRRGFAIYRFDPARAARAASDQPQWIVVTWAAEGVANQDPAGTHLHRSVLERFNFDYVYNYFFDPDKVKGVPYAPLK